MGAHCATDRRRSECGHVYQGRHTEWQPGGKSSPAAAVRLDGYRRVGQRGYRDVEAIPDDYFDFTADRSPNDADLGVR